MIPKFDKRRKRVVSVNNFLIVVAVVMISAAAVFLIFSNINVNQRKNKLNAQIAAIQKQIDGFKEKNASLKEGIAKVGDSEYIEKVAREQLDLQKSGEKVVGFILPPQEPQNDSTDYWQPRNWWSFIKNQWNWVASKF